MSSETADSFGLDWWVKSDLGGVWYGLAPQKNQIESIKQMIWVHINLYLGAETQKNLSWVETTVQIIFNFFVSGSWRRKVYIPGARQAGCWYISDTMWEKELEQCGSIKHTASIILGMDQWVRMCHIPLNPGTATHTHLSSTQLRAILRE